MQQQEEYLTRKQFHDCFGFEQGSILFHTVAAPMEQDGRARVFGRALVEGVAATLAYWEPYIEFAEQYAEAHPTLN